MPAPAGNHQIHFPVAELLAPVDLRRALFYALTLWLLFRPLDVLGFLLPPGTLERQRLIGQAEKNSLVNIGIKGLAADPRFKAAVLCCFVKHNGKNGSDNPISCRAASGL